MAKAKVCSNTRGKPLALVWVESRMFWHRREGERLNRQWGWCWQSDEGWWPLYDQFTQTLVYVIVRVQLEIGQNASKCSRSIQKIWKYRSRQPACGCWAVIWMGGTVWKRRKKQLIRVRVFGVEGSLCSLLPWVLAAQSMLLNEHKSLGEVCRWTQQIKGHFSEDEAHQRFDLRTIY